jgi:membrane protease subunit HflC
MRISGILLAILALVVLFIGYSSLFEVYQTRQAIVVRLGAPVRVIFEPGLNVKWPLIESVIYIDKRILDLENPAQEIIASDQKRLVVDAFARYRIVDPLLFYQTVGSVQNANSQLATILNAGLRRVLGEATFIQLVRDQREELMAKIRDHLDSEARTYGINVVDVRIGRGVPRPGQPAGAGDPVQGRPRRDRADRRRHQQGRADPRRGRCLAQQDLRRRLWAGPGLLRLLSLHAGL